jgi:hypothetical protein
MRSEILALSLIYIPAVGAADTIPDEAVNTYFAVSAPIEDYPNCDEPGQIAFRTDFTAEDVDFLVHGSRFPEGRPASSGIPQAIVDGNLNGGAKVEVPPICSRIIMRGTKSSQIEFECGDTERMASSAFEELRATQSTMSFRGSVNSCMSMSGYRVVDGTWETTVHDGLSSATYSGIFQPWGDACPVDIGQTPPRVSLRYAVAGTWGHPVDYISHPIFRHVGSPHEAAFFGLDIGGIPLAATEPGQAGLTASARMVFFLSSADDTICPDGVCTMPPAYRYPRPNPEVCR